MPVESVEAVLAADRVVQIAAVEQQAAPVAAYAAPALAAIGFDATAAGVADSERGGVYQYVAQLARHLAAATRAEVKLLFTLPHPRHLPAVCRFASSLDGDRVSAYRTLLPQRWLRRLRVPADSVVGSVDVFHSPAHLGLKCRNCPVVVTVHDVSFLRDRAGEDMRRQLARADRRRWLMRRRFFGELREHMAGSLAGAARVIAVSHATARELARAFDVPPEKVRVVHNGVRPDLGAADARRVQETRAELGGEEGRYWLYLGQLDPNKNIDTLLEGYARFRARGGRGALVVAGRGQFYGPLLERQARELGIRGHVRFAGYVPDDKVGLLCAAAHALVMPSPLEGFGMPALEGMACGAPVIAAAGGALPEVVGHAAALVSPYEADAYADAMLRLADDEAWRAHLVAAGKARAAQFSWSRAAQETLGVYAEAAGVARSAAAGLPVLRTRAAQ